MHHFKGFDIFQIWAPKLRTYIFIIAVPLGRCLCGFDVGHSCSKMPGPFQAYWLYLGLLRFDLSECHWGVFFFEKILADRYVLFQIHFVKTANAPFRSLRIFLNMATNVNISCSCDYDMIFICLYILLSDFDVGRCSAIYVSDSLQDVKSIQLRELHSCWNIASPQSNTWT
jgi:hypothetical protein